MIATVLNVEAAHRSPGNATKIGISYTLVLLILLADQLLLPMFRVGPVSFKLSYFFLGFWLIHSLSRNDSATKISSDVVKIFSSFLVIVFCILLGEVWLSANYAVASYYESIRGVLTFIFAALAFGLGRTTARFRFEWLLPIFYCAVALNLLFIFGRTDLPGWLIELYIPDRATSDMAGFQTATDILSLVRPRGLFGNPNTSMLMVNVLLLFICLGIRSGALQIRSWVVGYTLIVLPLCLAGLLATRGGFLAAIILCALIYQALMRALDSAVFKRMKLYLILSSIALVYLAARLADAFAIGENIDRILKIGSIFAAQEDQASSIYRPLIAFELFVERFTSSPIFGTGISAADSFHFADGTQYFHNDLFYILAVSGVVGAVALLSTIRHLYRRIGWPVVIPFVLPGLVNTFLLTIPAFISYFAMAGALISVVERQRQIVGLGSSALTLPNPKDEVFRGALGREQKTGGS